MLELQLTPEEGQVILNALQDYASKYKGVRHEHWSSIADGLRRKLAREVRCHEQQERKAKVVTQLKERGSVDCACGKVITPATPHVDVGPDGVLWHGNAEGGGHRADVEP